MTPEQITSYANLLLRYAKSVEEGKPIVLQCRYANQRLVGGVEAWFPLQDYHFNFAGHWEYREKPDEKHLIPVYDSEFVHCDACLETFAIITTNEKAFTRPFFCPSCACLNEEKK